MLSTILLSSNIGRQDLSFGNSAETRCRYMFPSKPEEDCEKTQSNGSSRGVCLQGAIAAGISPVVVVQLLMLGGTQDRIGHVGLCALADAVQSRPIRNRLGATSLPRPLQTLFWELEM